jgi:hypothetical protein
MRRAMEADGTQSFPRETSVWMRRAAEADGTKCFPLQGQMCGCVVLRKPTVPIFLLYYNFIRRNDVIYVDD